MFLCGMLRHIVRAVGQILGQLNSRQSGGFVVVVSRPFVTPEGWCIFRGNAHRYWHQYYSTLEEAEAAQSSAVSAVFLGGEVAAIEVITLDQYQAKRITTEEDYKNMLANQ